ncbi:hypothetical protein VNO77_03210 [Canavalia gladiata]|uniref:Uncharacterized protein n=1 Tax=Canavalia gladiata TaxID=3824 RepID=A0AAN9MZZ0_CANGL
MTILPALAKLPDLYDLALCLRSGTDSPLSHAQSSEASFRLLAGSSDSFGMTETEAYADQAKNGFLGRNKFYNALRHSTRSRRLDRAAPDKVRDMRGGSHQLDPWTVRHPC